MDLWRESKIPELASECRCIQQRLNVNKRKTKDEDDQLAQSFSKFMRQGKVKSALRLLSKYEGMVLDVDTPVTNDSNEDRTILDELKYNIQTRHRFLWKLSRRMKEKNSIWSYLTVLMETNVYSLQTPLKLSL